MTCTERHVRADRTDPTGKVQCVSGFTWHSRASTDNSVSWVPVASVAREVSPWCSAAASGLLDIRVRSGRRWGLCELSALGWVSSRRQLCFVQRVAAGLMSAAGVALRAPPVSTSVPCQAAPKRRRHPRRHPRHHRRIGGVVRRQHPSPRHRALHPNTPHNTPHRVRRTLLPRPRRPLRRNRRRSDRARSGWRSCRS